LNAQQAGPDSRPATYKIISNDDQEERTAPADEVVVSRVALHGRVPLALIFTATSEEVHLYAYLTTFDLKMTHEAWPGRELAAEELGWSIRTLDRHMAKLEERKAIRRTQGGNGRPSTIELLADVTTSRTGLPEVAALPKRFASLAKTRKRTSIEREKNRDAFSTSERRADVLYDDISEEQTLKLARNRARTTGVTEDDFRDELIQRKIAPDVIERALDEFRARAAA
jgi:hypothetical protein